MSKQANWIQAFLLEKFLDTDLSDLSNLPLILFYEWQQSLETLLPFFLQEHQEKLFNFLNSQINPALLSKVSKGHDNKLLKLALIILRIFEHQPLVSAQASSFRIIFDIASSNNQSLNAIHQQTESPELVCRAFATELEIIEPPRAEFEELELTCLPIELKGKQSVANWQSFCNNPKHVDLVIHSIIAALSKQLDAPLLLSRALDSLRSQSNIESLIDKLSIYYDKVSECSLNNTISTKLLIHWIDDHSDKIPLDDRRMLTIINKLYTSLELEEFDDSQLSEYCPITIAKVSLHGKLIMAATRWFFQDRKDMGSLIPEYFLEFLAHVLKTKNKSLVVASLSLRLNSFYLCDPEWTKTHLLCYLKPSKSDPNLLQSVWCGYLYSQDNSYELALAFKNDFVSLSSQVKVLSYKSSYGDYLQSYAKIFGMLIYEIEDYLTVEEKIKVTEALLSLDLFHHAIGIAYSRILENFDEDKQPLLDKVYRFLKSILPKDRSLEHDSKTKAVLIKICLRSTSSFEQIFQLLKPHLKGFKGCSVLFREKLALAELKRRDPNSANTLIKIIGCQTKGCYSCKEIYAPSVEAVADSNGSADRV